jgi:hypothetical protein
MTRGCHSACESRLEVHVWRAQAERHRLRAQRWTAPARRRRARGERHPVEDFLFTYYFVSFNQLEQWHPGFGVSLAEDAKMPAWLRGDPYETNGSRVRLSPSGPSAKARVRLGWIRDLLVATRSRPPNYGCHGMHEWAMVYTGGEIRHRESCPLRLPQQEIDEFVNSRPIACSHFDAFRFFHPAARPLNRLQPTMDLRQSLEQPGCIHANMDLYKWAGKAMPWVGSDLLIDAFEHAMKLRELDMRASPYDLTSHGFEPIRVETEAGRSEYARCQQELAEAAAPIRDRLIEALARVLDRDHKAQSQRPPESDRSCRPA